MAFGGGLVGVCMMYVCMYTKSNSFFFSFFLILFLSTVNLFYRVSGYREFSL